MYPETGFLLNRRRLERVLRRDRIKGLLISPVAPIRRTTALSAPPHAGQAVSASDSVRVSLGSEAGSGLLAEDGRKGCGKPVHTGSVSAACVSESSPEPRSEAASGVQTVLIRAASAKLSPVGNRQARYCG